MSNDEIIRIADESGMLRLSDGLYAVSEERVLQFAEAVTATEREACAHDLGCAGHFGAADIIRARGTP